MRVLFPGVVRVIIQVPAATLAVQLSTPSDTVTVPVGVPAPGEFTVTEYITVTAVLMFDGFGELEFIVVVVLALLT